MVEIKYTCTHNRDYYIITFIQYDLSELVNDGYNAKMSKIDYLRNIVIYFDYYQGLIIYMINLYDKLLR